MPVDGECEILTTKSAMAVSIPEDIFVVVFNPDVAPTMSLARVKTVDDGRSVNMRLLLRTLSTTPWIVKEAKLFSKESGSRVGSYHCFFTLGEGHEREKMIAVRSNGEHFVSAKEGHFPLLSEVLMDIVEELHSVDGMDECMMYFEDEENWK